LHLSRKEKEWESSHSEVIIGRVEDRSGRFLDLTPDSGVSRLDARTWQGNGCYWIEDLNSTGGTRLNGVEIKSQGQKGSDGKRCLGWANR
jgi:pSer/pThr/pTyr-binding forkhead associated (FHA) protein